MITFARLKAEPGLLTADMRSPLFHGDGTMLAPDVILPAPGLAGDERRWELVVPYVAERYVSHGNFGRAEQGSLEGSRQLIQRLADNGAATHFLARDGHGHNLHAWGLSWPDALRWLLSTAGA